MSVIDQITGHYTAAERGSLEVPEWGIDDDPLVVYWTPLTVQEHGQIVRATQGNNSIFNVEVLLTKALNVDGEKLFDRGDKPKLLKGADARVIARVAEAILSEGDSVETHKEN